MQRGVQTPSVSNRGGILVFSKQARGGATLVPGTRPLSTGRSMRSKLDNAHLKCQACLDLLLERLGDGLVEVGQDLHGQLGIDALGADQIVEHVHEREADAIVVRARAPTLAFKARIGKQGQGQ